MRMDTSTSNIVNTHNFYNRINDLSDRNPTLFYVVNRTPKNQNNQIQSIMEEIRNKKKTKHTKVERGYSAHWVRHTTNVPNYYTQTYITHIHFDRSHWSPNRSSAARQHFFCIPFWLRLPTAKKRALKRTYVTAAMLYGRYRTTAITDCIKLTGGGFHNNDVNNMSSHSKIIIGKSCMRARWRSINEILLQ